MDLTPEAGKRHFNLYIMRLEKMNASILRSIVKIDRNNEKKVKKTKHDKNTHAERKILEQYFEPGYINFTATDVLNILVKNKIGIDTNNRRLAKALSFLFGEPKNTKINGRTGNFYFLCTNLDI